VRWPGVGLILLAAVPAFPQARFEVASIRPSQPGATVRDFRLNIRGGTLEVKAATVGDILDLLAGVGTGASQLGRLAGGPEWMHADRYDIQAKAEHEIPGPEQVAAIMALLADRFKLKSHKETREVPAIVLRILKMPNGLKPAANPAGDDKAFSVSRDARGDLAFKSALMGRFTNYLSQMLRAPVVDETGLNGAFDFKLPMSEVSTQPTQSYGDRVREAAEAFGFRIEEKKIPLEVTVIDRLERPSEN
jgi:uncharacterized protein (TIGR03435 family)